MVPVAVYDRLNWVLNRDDMKKMVPVPVTHAEPGELAHMPAATSYKRMQSQGNTDHRATHTRASRKSGLRLLPLA